MIWIVGISLASMAAIVGGTAGTLRQLAHAHDPRQVRRVSLRARYRRGRHQATRPPLWARLLEAYLAGAREYAAAHALITGGAL